MEIQSPRSGLRKAFRYPYLKEFGIKLHIALCLIFFFQISKYVSMLRHSHDSFIIGYMQDKSAFLHIWVSTWHLHNVNYQEDLINTLKVPRISELLCFEREKKYPRKAHKSKYAGFILTYSKLDILCAIFVPKSDRYMYLIYWLRNRSRKHKQEHFTANLLLKTGKYYPFSRYN